jgi:uncharacterized membrane protein
MAEPAKKTRPPAADSLGDPTAVARAYQLQRARRRAREQRNRERRAAQIRFWLIVLGLLALSAYLTLVIWHEVQRLFGL